MIHNKQYYIDKYVKRMTELDKKYKNDFDQQTEEFEQVCTPEEIAGYYLFNEGDCAFAVWLDNLSFSRENERELYKESDSEVTSIFKDLEDLEVINNYILNVVDGNGKDNDSIRSIHAEIKERYRLRDSDIELISMPNEVLGSMQELTGEDDLYQIYFSYYYDENDLYCAITADGDIREYQIELDHETESKVIELFEDAIKFRQNYDICQLELSQYYHDAIEKGESVDDWGCASLWITEDFGVEYNLCYDGKECYSAIYVMRCDENKGTYSTDYDNYAHYEINCKNNNWVADLKDAMYKFAVEEYKADHKEVKGDDNVNETKKETTTETKGNTVYVTIYDAQEDPMLSSAGLRTTTEISFDNVRGITYEGEYCVIWYNDTKTSYGFRIKEIAMITFGNK